MKKALLLAVLGLGLTVPARADGMLDPAFGSGGVASVHVMGNDRMFALAMLPDGRAVAVGTAGGGPGDSSMAIVRVLSSGTPDPAFDGDGRVVVSFDGAPNAVATSLATFPDGGVVVAGVALSSFALVRLDANGALESTFGTGGKVLAPCPSGSCTANAVVLQPDGRIVVGGPGSTGGVVMRFHPNGTLDASFGTGGVASLPEGWQLDVRAVALHDDGRIALGGTQHPTPPTSDLAAARLLADGSPDTSFGGDGLATFVDPLDQTGLAVLAQTGGAVIVGGTRSTDTGPFFAMVRFLADGTPDRGFGTGGLTAAVAGGLAPGLIQVPNGNLVQAGVRGSFDVGPAPNFALARYLPNGTLDPTFGSAGILEIDLAGSRDFVAGLAYAGPERLLVGGTIEVLGVPIFPADFAFARFIAATPVALQSYGVE
jgi:uncharacterized delta-60 repeat protein